MARVQIVSDLHTEFWGEASLTVEQYPDAVLTLTLYTLSLDKIWLQV